MKKKILIYIQNIGYGGTARLAVNLAGAFAGNGNEVLLLTDVKMEQEYTLSDLVTRTRTPVKADVLFAFGIPAAKRLCRTGIGSKNLFIVDRADPEQAYAKRKDRAGAMRLYRKAAGILLQTRHAMQFWPEEVQKKCHILPPLMEIRYFTGNGEWLEAARRRHAICCCGQFREGSGHLALVQCFEKITEDYPDYVLELYGSRSADNTIFQVKELVKSHHLEEKVRFYEHADSMDKNIQSAMLYVMPAMWSGVSVSLMEAMALGTAVVASDNPDGGTRVLIEDGYNGLMFQAGDKEELYIAMKKFLDEPSQIDRISREAGKVRERFAREKVITEWMRLLNETTD